VAARLIAARAAAIAAATLAAAVRAAAALAAAAIGARAAIDAAAIERTIERWPGFARAAAVRLALALLEGQHRLLGPQRRRQQEGGWALRLLACWQRAR